MKEENKCPVPAQFQLPWAGKILKACIYHANALCTVAHVTGTPIKPEVYTGDEKCYSVDNLKELGIELN